MGVTYNCQICGVSAKISRIRCPGEPASYSHAWSSSLSANFLGNQNFVRCRDRQSDPYPWDYAGECADCLFVNRSSDSPDQWDREPFLADDEEFEVVEDTRDEPYEFTSPKESEDEASDEEGAEVEERESGSEVNQETDHDDTDSISALMQSSEFPKREKFCKMSDVLYALYGDHTRPPKFLAGAPLHARDEMDSFDAEHIATVTCRCPLGYNGHYLSPEEAKGCTTLQGLVPKPKSGHSHSPDDQDYERDGDYFLSGLIDFPTSETGDNRPCFPERHGCKEPRLRNHISENDPEEALETLGMPFHPSCLEVFHRASLHRNKRIDVGSLMTWFRLSMSGDGYETFNYQRHEAVRRGQRGVKWCHTHGDEWLAANPCYIPRMKSIVEEASFDDHADYHQDAFGSGNKDTTGTDCFSELPLELKLNILEQLTAEDISALRAASRSFWTLPQSFFHHLLMRDAPWFWEAWCSRPYSFWTTTSQTKMNSVDRTDLRIALEVMEEHMVMIGQQDDLAVDPEEILGPLREALEKEEEEEMESRRSQPAICLDQNRTDWCRLYGLVMRQKKSVNGLKKRAVVWEDCQRILDGIQSLRDKGEMDQFAIARAA